MAIKLTDYIGGRISPLLRAVADKLNSKGIPDTEIIRRGIRRIAEEEGISLEEIARIVDEKSELKKLAKIEVPA